MRYIVVDIGNTRTTLALAGGGQLKRVACLQASSNATGSIREVVRRVSRGVACEGSILCSVVPSSTAAWRSLLEKATGRPPLLVDHRLRLGVTVDYPKPSSIGADRLANACGAVERYGAPVIVADFGTALTFDVVSPDRRYVGGVIAPGLPLMTDYLAEKTALLPEIRLRSQRGWVGRSTVGAMRIGAKVGYRGMVREIVRHIAAGMRRRKVALCATGGYAEWALEGLDMPFAIDPELTLHGLDLIYRLNREDGPAGKETE